MMYPCLLLPVVNSVELPGPKGAPIEWAIVWKEGEPPIIMVDEDYHSFGRAAEEPSQTFSEADLAPPPEPDWRAERAALLASLGAPSSAPASAPTRPVPPKESKERPVHPARREPPRPSREEEPPPAYYVNDDAPRDGNDLPESVIKKACKDIESNDYDRQEAGLDVLMRVPMTVLMRAIPYLKPGTRLKIAQTRNEVESEGRPEETNILGPALASFAAGEAANFQNDNFVGAADIGQREAQYRAQPETTPEFNVFLNRRLRRGAKLSPKEMSAYMASRHRKD